MARQKAYYKDTGVEVKHGDIIHNFRGEECIFEGVSRDGGPGYSAKVLTEGTWSKYAQVFTDIEVR